MKTLDSKRIIPMMHREDEKNRKKIAKYHKCIFHLHTPSSHDYRLLNDDLNWKQISDSEMLKCAEEQGQITKDHIMEDFEKYQDDLFESPQEVLAFFLVAYELLKKEISLVVITDHNTINGFEKLKRAISIVYGPYKNYFSVYTHVILGVEISCSDKCHVVGIFNENKDSQIKALDDWLSKYIISEEEGTNLNSHAVLEAIHAIGGIGYIAHINSSGVFNPKFLTGTYRRSLFGLDFHTFFGVSDLSKAQDIKSRIQQISDREFDYIVDEDSHSLQEIGEKAFWIKGQILDFDMVYNAFKDFKSTISHTIPMQPQSYIKSVYIDNKCFYRGKNGGGMIIPFSMNMNSLIGGRGTGKSTILNIIEFLTSQIVDSRNTLKYILRQGSICLLYYYRGIDYYIMFHSGGDDENDRAFINSCFSNHFKSRYYEDSLREKNLRKQVIRQRVQIYTYNNNIIEDIPDNEVQKILNQIFTRKFSVNDLVNIAGNRIKTMDFILEMMFNNDNLQRGIKVSPTLKTWEGIRKKYNKIGSLLDERRYLVTQVIDPFNESQANKIKIIYEQTNINNFIFPWDRVLDIYEIQFSKPFRKYKITNQNVIGLLEYLSSKTNPIDVILKIYDRNYNPLKELFDIEKYLMSNSYRTVDAQLKTIDDTNIEEFFDLIRGLVSNKEYYIVQFLKEYLSEIDLFSLEFNINNKESVGNLKPHFKPIDEISMGQKVVAMLSFILAYSKFRGDESPLIIDQPEDNLDNQYIYRNLVKDFRDIKDYRQIIIATHNSTIVVNTGCENVVVLESDNKGSSMQKNGYCQREDINHEIINKLEGGKEAFKQKVRIYRDNIDLENIY